MFQIRNDFEVVEALRKEMLHLRELATRTGMTPSTLMRLLDRLVAENVIDARQEGKNRKCFLKKTVEADAYLRMSAQYKLLKAIQNDKLRRIVTEARRETAGELILLFGSHAKGAAVGKSDIDLYVESDNPELKGRLRRIDSALSITAGKFGKDTELGKEIIRNHVLIQNGDRWFQLLSGD